jgi:hypothetical protein
LIVAGLYCRKGEIGRQLARAELAFPILHSAAVCRHNAR